MLASQGNFTIEHDGIIMENYPFQPSVAYQHKRLAASEIININFRSAPPTVRIKDELVFLSADKKDQLAEFAITHRIPTVERDDVWDWLLEPFLDTDYSVQTHRRLTALLASYGLTESRVTAIREEVKTQMLKYNFDTMLWDWVHLGALDVLLAMRPTYDTEQFAGFYRRVMDIALLPDKQPMRPT